MAKKEYSLEAKEGYAYLDKGDILHITDHREWAEEKSANGNIVETMIPHDDGYPLGETGKGVDTLIVYGPEEIKVRASDDKSLNVRFYPHLTELWKACKG